MWYQKLLEVLIPKIKKEQQKQAKEFLALLFNGLQRCSRRHSDELIPPLVLFGLIDKTFKKYDSQEEGTLELTSFARDLTGLSIILMKAAFDAIVWYQDFNLQRRKMLSALGLDTPETTFKPQTQVLKSEISEDAGWSDEEELPDDIEEAPDFLSKIKFLEIKTFHAWDYDLTVDFDHLLSILVSNHFVVAPEIYAYCKQGFIGISEDFDEFICNLILMHKGCDHIERGNLDKLQRLLHPNDNTLKLFKEIINKHLNNKARNDDTLKFKHLNNKARNALLQFALDHDQYEIASYLNDEIEKLVEHGNDLNENLPQLVSSENEAPLSAIQIDQLLKNRGSSPTREKLLIWKNANLELLAQIAKRLPLEQFSINWTSITVNPLCELLEIPTLQQLLLINIVDTLINNIETKHGGRWTSGINSEKVNALKTIKTKIKAEKGLEDSVVQTYLQNIMAVCHIKRNSLHFWATPNSVTEFKHLLEDNKFDLPVADMRLK